MEKISLENYFYNIFKASVLHQSYVEYFSAGPTALEGSTDRLFGVPDGTIRAYSSEPSNLSSLGLVLSEYNIETGQFEENDELNQIAKDNFKKTDIWSICEILYNYAVNGILDMEKWVYWDMDWRKLIQDPAMYFQMIHTDFSQIPASVKMIVDLGLLRLGIDEIGDLGSTFTHTQCEEIIALMANLDERTVKNADAQGLFQGISGNFDHRAIKLWLSTKRGFVPTRGLIKENEQSLDQVKTTLDFGLYLKNKRESLGALFDLKIFPKKHYLFNRKTIEELENGFFNLPLSTVSILANSYYEDEDTLLNCVMNVFFPYELEKIRGNEHG